VRNLLLILVCGCAALGDRKDQSFPTATEVLQVRWRHHLTEEPLIEYKPQEFAAATPSDDGQVVFVGSSAASFYAFTSRDGQVLWHVPIEGGAGQSRYVESEHAMHVQLISPGGIEASFRKLAEPGGEYDPASLPALAAEYGGRVDFDATMPILERHGLRFAERSSD